MATFRVADIEQERPDEEFVVEFESGNTYTLPHPRDIPAYDLINLQANDVPGSFMALLGDDYYDFTHEAGMTGRKLDAIFTGWIAHYGLEAEMGKAQNSWRPSSATPKRTKTTSRGKGTRS